MIASLAYRFTDLWIRSLSGVEVIGPIPQQSETYQELIRYRTEQNQLRAPYLEEKFQLDIENRLEIDARSLHFAVKKAGEIVACVRLTPLPFELSALNSAFSPVSPEFDEYFEFGRLCTELRLERKGFYAGVLVVKAAQHVFSKCGARGIVGICKTERVPYMQKLGLNVDPRPVFVASRGSHYHLIHASKQELVRYHLKRFIRMPFGKTQENRHEPRHA